MLLGLAAVKLVGAERANIWLDPAVARGHNVDGGEDQGGGGGGVGGAGGRDRKDKEQEPRQVDAGEGGDAAEGGGEPSKEADGGSG